MERNKKILNVGCGSDTYGTDFVDLYPKRAEVKKVNLDFEKLPYENETFDEVYSRCLLEHLRNPGNALEEMVRVLKKYGKLELITDNANHWLYALDNSLHTGEYETRSAGEEDKHYCLFTDWHLKNHLSKLGVEIEKIEYIENTSKQGFLIMLVNKILKHTPFWRMAYGQIRVVGKKVKVH